MKLHNGESATFVEMQLKFLLIETERAAERELAELSYGGKRIEPTSQPRIFLYTTTSDAANSTSLPGLQHVAMLGIATF